MVAAAWTHARWVVIALLVSIALNLFLAGMIGGRHMHGWWRDHDRPHATWMQDGDDRLVRHLLRNLTRDLDSDERAMFRETLEAQREPLIKSGVALLDQRRVVLERLRADPFDRAALDAALAELGSRHLAFQEQLMGAIADAAAALPPEARARLGGGWE